MYKNWPVYILIRTSGRPHFFNNMMRSIKEQTYKNIITIVHTDDPNDKYIDGDIIIRADRNPFAGSGFYNLYCNTLLKSIPDGPGWYHFMDDDDMYAAPDVIERLVENSKRECINIGRVQRWNQTVWPKRWGNQESYQTECFFLHTDHKNLATWHNEKGGDHNYSKQITKILPKNWIEDLLIAKAQKGKGRGKRNDLHDPLPVSKRSVELKEVSRVGARHMGEMVKVVFIKRVSGGKGKRGNAGQEKLIPMKYAKRLHKIGRVEILDKQILKLLLGA